MGGERAHGRREGTWKESTWEGRGHMGGERAPPSPLIPHHCQVLMRTIYP